MLGSRQTVPQTMYPLKTNLLLTFLLNTCFNRRDILYNRTVIFFESYYINVLYESEVISLGYQFKWGPITDIGANEFRKRSEEYNLLGSICSDIISVELTIYQNKKTGKYLRTVRSRQFPSLESYDKEINVRPNAFELRDPAVAFISQELKLVLQQMENDYKGSHNISAALYEAIKEAIFAVDHPERYQYDF